MKQIEINEKIFRLKDDNSIYYCVDTLCDYDLNVQCIYYIELAFIDRLPQNWQNKAAWLTLPKERFSEIDEIYKETTLNGDYVPAAELKNCFFMNLVSPDAQDEFIKTAKKQLIKAVGNVAEFVAERCGYSLEELAGNPEKRIQGVLSLEQIDSLAFAIYNSEARRQGFIVGDMTGVGKGRIAAAFIRYAIKQGKQPVFFTVNADLFVDLYRDLKNTHNINYKPFIINNIDIIDPDTKEVLFEKPTSQEYKTALRTRRLPKGYDYALCSYSQIGDAVSYKGFKINRSKDKAAKNNLIKELCANSYLVCDESHTIGGDWSRVPVKDTSTNSVATELTKIQGYRAWLFFSQILPLAKGCLYLSATFAKRPDNMPNYALQTCLSDVVSAGGITSLFRRGGVAVQEIVSTALVEYGQMLRREHRNDGITTEYITLDMQGADKYGVTDKSNLHRTKYSKVIDILAKIRDFELEYLQPYFSVTYPPVKITKKNAKDLETKEILDVKRRGMFNYLFDLLTGFIFSLKAEDMADRAIKHLNEGKKVVIGFSDTFETLYKIVDNSDDKDDSDNGEDGDDDDKSGIEIGKKTKLVYPKENTFYEKTDFITKFRNVFENITRYTVITKTKKKDENRLEEKNRAYADLADNMQELEKFREGAIAAYEDIKNTLQNTTIGISFSPIDIIVSRIEHAKNKNGKHFKVAESTGRTHYIQFTDENCIKGYFKNKTVPKGYISKCYEDFNNNIADVLLINATGSTGKSAHAIPTSKVPESEVKQRVMIIGQCESDINVEVQKRGRINRTGQIKLPAYEYIFSDIPCEKKMMMSLRKKLKSLYSNTSSDQNANEDLNDIDNFDNVYGIKAVAKYLYNLLESALQGEDEESFAILRFLSSDKDLAQTMSKKKIYWQDDYAALKLMKWSGDIIATFFSRIQALPIDRQEDIWHFVTAWYNMFVREAKDNGTYFLESEEKQFDAKLINEYCLYEGDNDNSRLTAATFIGHYDIKCQKQLTTSADLDVAKKDNDSKRELILKNLSEGYNKAITEINERKQVAIDRAKERLDGEIERLQERINTTQQNYDLLLDDLENVKPEKIKEIKEKLKALKDELKEKKGNYDSVFKERTAEVEKDFAERTANAKFKFQRLKKAIETLKVGATFVNENGIYYLVTEVSAPISGAARHIDLDPADKAIMDMINQSDIKVIAGNGDNQTVDLFSSPSNIIITLVSTDSATGNSLLKNLAEDGLKFLEENIISKKATPIKEWDDYVRSSRFREKAYIITGNIIPVINGVNKGTIVKFTKANGTKETGFLVQMERNERTGRMELPDTFNGVLVNIKDNKKAINAGLVNGSRFILVCNDLDRGLESTKIFSERESDEKMKYMLEMPNSHAHYIGIKYDYVEGYCYHTIENVDNMLDLLADKGYKIQISFNLLDQYGITLKGEKFVMKDWQPLTYDKNKIPKK